MDSTQATHRIFDQALQQARKRNASRITDIHIVIGELANFTEQTIVSSWEQISRETIAGDARLHFRRVPAELQCMACFTKYHPDTNGILCPVCGSVGAKVLHGEEFFMEALDVA